MGIQISNQRLDKHQRRAKPNHTCGRKPELLSTLESTNTSEIRSKGPKKCPDKTIKVQTSQDHTKYQQGPTQESHNLTLNKDSNPKQRQKNFLICLFHSCHFACIYLGDFSKGSLRPFTVLSIFLICPSLAIGPSQFGKI